MWVTKYERLRTNDADIFVLEYYGKHGPIIVETKFPSYLERWMEAGKELGFMPGDPNGFQKECKN